MNDAVLNVEPAVDSSSQILTDLGLTDALFCEQETGNLDDEKFVVFFLEDELFAVAAKQVAEVVRPIRFTPLPNSPAWLHGIANLRGEIVSVLNLSKICSKKPISASSKSKVIILRSNTLACSIAFPVDRLSEVMTLKAENVRPTEDFHSFGKAVYNANSVNLLDTEMLFASLS